MIRFTLFGVPVEIQPWFWLTTALVGGAAGATTAAHMQALVIFMLAATVSILVHEFGHALVGRRLGGGYARIVLWAFGGLAYNEGGRFNRWQSFWMVAAGPGAGVAFALVVLLALVVAFGPSDALGLAGRSLFGIPAAISDATLEFLRQKRQLYSLISSLLWINFWWSLINLLPVLPLDGGRITELFVTPQRLVYQIAIFAAVAMAAVGILWLGSIYTALLFGYLAWRNYQSLKEVSFR